jgi:predicted nucleic acid-binding protein
MTRVADSSFIITLFDEDDARHAEAWTRVRENEPIIVPAEVLTETIGVIHARRGYALAREVLAEFAKFPHVEFLETSEGDVTESEFLGGGGRLSWVDAAVVARCKVTGASPLCYDDNILAAVAGRPK